MKEKNLPQEVGYYLAYTSGYEWYNLIVRVYGDKPFFKIDTWDVTNHVLVPNTSLSEIGGFGPKILDDMPYINRKS